MTAVTQNSQHAGEIFGKIFCVCKYRFQVQAADHSLLYLCIPWKKWGIIRNSYCAVKIHWELWYYLDADRWDHACTDRTLVLAENCRSLSQHEKHSFATWSNFQVCPAWAFHWHTTSFINPPLPPEKKFERWRVLCNVFLSAIFLHSITYSSLCLAQGQVTHIFTCSSQYWCTIMHLGTL